MTSVMRVHVPQANDLHKHFAFVAQEIDLTKEVIILYDERSTKADMQKSLMAGIYGFRSKENRDRFISMLNGAGANEIAFIASINPATGPVAKPEGE